MPAKKIWLMKTEPDVFSWDDLMKMPEQTTMWEGVRNFQARNLMRDQFKVGDRVLFYHSNIGKAIVGLAKVVRPAYPDPTQFDTRSKYYDPGSKLEDPRWLVVDVKAVRKLPEALPLERLREVRALNDMMLLRKGARLSVQPVTPAQYRAILKTAGISDEEG
ncbi:MAG: EVE domain-containing protein [Armatimonadetes bacterium]|nr:EVE domain-containing protein [Armatimonadota bacterium]